MTGTEQEKAERWAVESEGGGERVNDADGVIRRVAHEEWVNGTDVRGNRRDEGTETGTDGKLCSLLVRAMENESQ